MEWSMIKLEQQERLGSENVPHPPSLTPTPSPQPHHHPPPTPPTPTPPPPHTHTRARPVITHIVDSYRIPFIPSQQQSPKIQIMESYKNKILTRDTPSEVDWWDG